MNSFRQAISQHRELLEAAGLVVTRREDRYKSHHLDTSPLRARHGRAMAERWPSTTVKETECESTLASVFVDDQDKALRFYTDVLGFEPKTEIPLGDTRWLTVVSPEDRAGTELVLEPDSHPAVRPFKESLIADGIPYTSFAVDDVHAEAQRLKELGVRFTQEPLEMGQVTTAVFEDTRGNLIQIAAHA